MGYVSFREGILYGNETATFVEPVSLALPLTGAVAVVAGLGSTTEILKGAPKKNHATKKDDFTGTCCNGWL